ncbi:hypothetical protein EJ05DRAFT_534582 [Pseudovirgaria hyperparasitica]|uniref:Zn(2)-C6 fungal-type domain-containing protein n=1 Tax=Pseudovirgaria hyperparasitica TaxID=470096 RepID=A0A6A6WM08_9PEZI|nr:uncharacterized protein EJ05DRAFT_534582 [Pseudovirgaria hyperparasitica]KAF2763188.1 hypothetical protein EJ05DRAFT_534582 [Pseudovirgaria hyperparasitica]
MHVNHIYSVAKPRPLSFICSCTSRLSSSSRVCPHVPRVNKVHVTSIALTILGNFNMLHSYLTPRHQALLIIRLSNLHTFLLYFSMAELPTSIILKAVDDDPPDSNPSFTIDKDDIQTRNDAMDLAFEEYKKDRSVWNLHFHAVGECVPGPTSKGWLRWLQQNADSNGQTLLYAHFLPKFPSPDIPRIPESRPIPAHSLPVQATTTQTASGELTKGDASSNKGEVSNSVERITPAESSQALVLMPLNPLPGVSKPPTKQRVLQLVVSYTGDGGTHGAEGSMPPYDMKARGTMTNKTLVTKLYDRLVADMNKSGHIPDELIISWTKYVYGGEDPTEEDIEELLEPSSDRGFKTIGDFSDHYKTDLLHVELIISILDPSSQNERPFANIRDALRAFPSVSRRCQRIEQTQVAGPQNRLKRRKLTATAAQEEDDNKNDDDKLIPWKYQRAVTEPSSIVSALSLTSADYVVAGKDRKYPKIRVGEDKISMYTDRVPECKGRPNILGTKNVVYMSATFNNGTLVPRFFIAWTDYEGNVLPVISADRAGQSHRSFEHVNFRGRFKPWNTLKTKTDQSTAARAWCAASKVWDIKPSKARSTRALPKRKSTEVTRRAVENPGRDVASLPAPLITNEIGYRRRNIAVSINSRRRRQRELRRADQIDDTDSGQDVQTPCEPCNRRSTVCRVYDPRVNSVIRRCSACIRSGTKCTLVETCPTADRSMTMEVVPNLKQNDMLVPVDNTALAEAHSNVHMNTAVPTASTAAITRSTSRDSFVELKLKVRSLHEEGADGDMGRINVLIKKDDSPKQTLEKVKDEVINHVRHLGSDYAYLLEGGCAFSTQLKLAYRVRERTIWFDVQDQHVGTIMRYVSDRGNEQDKVAAQGLVTLRGRRNLLYML